MTGDAGDPAVCNLLRLPVLAPDPARTDRVRARCHAALACRQQEAEGTTRRAHFGSIALGPALIGALCLMYLAALIHDVLRLGEMY